MVGKVLPGNGSTTNGNGAYSPIGGDELSHAVRRYRSPITSCRVSATAVSRWVSPGCTRS